jgi:hypothetical protein
VCDTQRCHRRRCRSIDLLIGTNEPFISNLANVLRLEAPTLKKGDRMKDPPPNRRFPTPTPPPAEYVDGTRDITCLLPPRHEYALPYAPHSTDTPDSLPSRRRRGSISVRARFSREIRSVRYDQANAAGSALPPTARRSGIGLGRRLLGVTTKRYRAPTKEDPW